jgi:hypothetical protein
MLLPPAAVFAQNREEVRVIETENARETRERLREILNEYPPSVGQVLRLDPSLLTRQDYMAPYPRLAAFVSQHPDIVHNPSFYLGDAPLSAPDNNRAAAMRLANDIAGWVFGGTIFAIVVGFLVWVIRTVVEYRAWRHATKVQTDAHAKIFDRLTSNDELLAYVQSPTGQRFLGVGAQQPALSRPSARALGAPIGRILWSVQAGVVLAAGGVGLWLARTHVIEELAQGFDVVAMLAVAVGIGFVLSALVAYGLSSRLGLIERQPQSTHA